MATKKSKNPVVATLAGAIAGGVEATAVWPMEFIKTQLQLQEKMKAGEKPKFTGMVSGLRYTVNSTGFFSLYRGLAPVLIGSIPKAGLRFGCFDYFKGFYAGADGKVGPLQNLAAGVTAGVVEATLAVTPMETIKTRLIHGNMGMVQGTISILKSEGIGGIYKGLVPTIAKQASNQGIRFLVFNEYKDAVVSRKEDSSEGLRPLEALLGGMISGSISTMFNNPFDVVKTRMQGLEARKYSGVGNCFSTVMKNEGFGAFYAGVVPRLWRVVPGQGIIFMSYEQISAIVEGFVDK